MFSKKKLKRIYKLTFLNKLINISFKENRKKNKKNNILTF